MRIEKEWGRVKQLTFNQASSVKILEIDPKCSTRLHYHNMRDDLWLVLDDGVGIQIGDRVVVARSGQEFVVPSGTPHRLYSTVEHPVRVLEIAFGYTDEDDQVFLE
jgi:mannose-6-phosphate isomerase